MLPRMELYSKLRMLFLFIFVSPLRYKAKDYPEHAYTNIIPAITTSATEHIVTFPHFCIQRTAYPPGRYQDHDPTKKDPPVLFLAVTFQW